MSSGKNIFIAGPGLAVLAYILTGTLMWYVAPYPQMISLTPMLMIMALRSAMACMAEMTALFPVKGPTFEFARRFVDESVGYACAWMLW